MIRNGLFTEKIAFLLSFFPLPRIEILLLYLANRPLHHTTDEVYWNHPVLLLEIGMKMNQSQLVVSGKQKINNNYYNIIEQVLILISSNLHLNTVLIVFVAQQ